MSKISDYAMMKYKLNYGRKIREKSNCEQLEKDQKQAQAGKYMSFGKDGKRRFIQIYDDIPEVAENGLYWFMDLNGEKWLVEVNTSPTPSTMLKVGLTIVLKVDSIGVGEFIGPIIS